MCILYLNTCFVLFLAWLVIFVELVYSRAYGVVVSAPSREGIHNIIIAAISLLLCC